jgi:hypothetical protein
VNGKLVAGFIVIVALATGAAIYWLQEYAYYTDVSFQPGAEIALTELESGQPQPILADNVQGVDATSSPLRFRACFHTPMSQAMLTETYKVYEHPTPLNGPNWFDCFDAAAIGAALDSGEAIAFLSQANIAPSIDRVVAVFPDGRAYAWHQISPDAEQ